MKRLNQKGEGEIIGLIIFAIIAFGIYTLFIKKDKWQIVYVNSNGDSQVTGSFGSKESCIKQLRSFSYNEGECGSNCKPSSSGIDVYHCEETVD